MPFSWTSHEDDDESVHGEGEHHIVAPPHKLNTLVSELKRLDEDSILAEAQEIDNEGSDCGWNFPWLRSGSSKAVRPSIMSATSYVTRMPLEVRNPELWAFCNDSILCFQCATY